MINTEKVINFIHYHRVPGAALDARIVVVQAVWNQIEAAGILALRRLGVE